MGKVNRRLVLLGGMAAVGAVAVPSWAAATAGAGVAAIRYPFELGVASGDPLPDSVVLWTRLAPSPLNVDGFGGMPDATFTVSWELASDEKFSSVVQSGQVATNRSLGYSVHVEPVGLQPGAEYFYRFKVDGHISPVGRTRTAPAAGSTPSRLTFCMASCQQWEDGWYHAHRGIAADAPDLVLFLGDYIYEKPSGEPDEYRPRRVVVTDELTTLALYRHRYAQYRTDPDLQAAHAVAPWVSVLDDHEVDNNWNSTEPATTRKAAAFQAFWENTPLRAAQKPSGASMSLYRRINWGTLARFHMLDTRQYRTAQLSTTDCAQRTTSSRTLTGSAQEQWLLKALETHPATWDLLGQQVFFAQRDTDGKSSTCDDTSMDAWDGYTAARDRIAQGWIDRGVPNPVVLTGDVHQHYAADLRRNYYDHSGPIIGSELITTGITSNNGRASVPSSTWFANNPHIKYCSVKRGYVRTTLTPQLLTADFVTVSDVVERDPAKVTIATDRTYVLEAGSRGLQLA
ncbi:alkaline phosphatase D family protein [Goodfellowiella coeruleoviolacea]|uniref:Alkaline phosphatase D n=1 Tax=Goodfellowiella coeruleoviolacea TaxID=334858 RepID=A0AAE3GL13_9PSEU|nr:alkaline phosphatase D family protein [Goodfellowiella coeruleoviolacea]MCP2169437.1 alkaline phosphatase D [Goodfellowiella coeruleoviolacea]